jgi:hypothetical protein
MTDSPVTPVKGYTAQSKGALRLVNENKEIEERVLRRLDHLATVKATEGGDLDIDGRWLAIARTHIQEAFMAANRAIMNPQRIKLPEDGPN